MHSENILTAGIVFAWQSFGSGMLQGCIVREDARADPMYNRESSSQLSQDGPASGQGAHQQQW